MRFFIFITVFILLCSSCEKDEGNRKITLEDFTKKIVELDDSIVSVEFTYKKSWFQLDSLKLENDNQIEDINVFRLGCKISYDYYKDFAYTQNNNVLIAKCPCVEFFYWCRKRDIEKYKIIVYGSLY